MRRRGATILLGGSSSGYGGPTQLWCIWIPTSGYGCLTQAWHIWMPTSGHGCLTQLWYFRIPTPHWREDAPSGATTLWGGTLRLCRVMVVTTVWHIWIPTPRLREEAPPGRNHPLGGLPVGLWKSHTVVVHQDTDVELWM